MYLTFQYVFQNFCSVMDTVVVVSCIEYICILAVVLASISLWGPLGYLIIYHNSKVTVMADGGRQRDDYVLRFVQAEQNGAQEAECGWACCCAGAWFPITGTCCACACFSNQRAQNLLPMLLAQLLAGTMLLVRLPVPAMPNGGAMLLAELAL